MLVFGNSLPKAFISVHHVVLHFPEDHVIVKEDAEPEEWPGHHEAIKYIQCCVLHVVESEDLPEVYKGGGPFSNPGELADGADETSYVDSLHLASKAQDVVSVGL